MPTPPPAAALPARYYARLAALLGELGVSPRAWLKAARVSEHRLFAADGELGLDEVERLSRTALRLSGRADLGLLLGAAIEPASHAALGQAMLRSASLDAALRLAARYFSLLSPGFRLHYRLAADGGEVWIHPRLPFGVDALRLHLDTVLVAFLGELRFLHGGALPALAVDLSQRQPDYHASYRLWVTGRLRFAAERLPGLRIRLPASLLLAPRPQASDPAERRARQRCDDLLRRTHEQRQLSGWTRMMLREAQHGLPGQAELASLLALSVRSFARQLAAEGASFRQLLTEVRLQRATAELSEGQHSITAIAHQLGYRDAANFSRAFRRRHGLSPRDWRQRQPN